SRCRRRSAPRRGPRASRSAPPPPAVPAARRAGWSSPRSSPPHARPTPTPASLGTRARRPGQEPRLDAACPSDERSRHTSPTDIWALIGAQNRVGLFVDLLAALEHGDEFAQAALAGLRFFRLGETVGDRVAV